MDILIRGAGFVNKGAEAMLRTVEVELGRRLEKARFCIRVAEDDVQEMELTGLHLFVSQGNKLRKLGSLIAMTLLDPLVLKSALISPHAALQIKDLRNVSAVVDISGFSFTDEWGYEASKLASMLVGYFEKKGKPCLFLPQSWGPFNHPLVAKYTRSFCRRASVIYARDQQSYNYLIELLNGYKANIQSAPDIAFRFKAAEPQVGSALLSKYGVELGTGSVIGLVPNVRVYERIANSGTDNLYVKIMVDIAEHCIEELGTTVVLIPHEVMFGKGGQTDDCCLCGVIKAAIEEKGKGPVATMVGDYYSAEAIKSAIGHLDLLVGSRYHSLVAALSSRVPAVTLGWSHKYVELMRLVGLEDYVVDYSKLGRSVVLEKVSDAWSKRKANKALLESRLPGIENDVDAVFDYVAEVIKASC